MSAIEIIAVLFSLLCIALAVKKHVLNWPAGIIGVSAYMVLFFRERLYADMALQIIFIVQGIYGWYNWNAGQKEDNQLTAIYLSVFQRLIYLSIIAVLSIAWYFLLKHYTNASTPFVDASAATISLVANWLMARRYVENWLLWIFVDVIYIGLFWYKGLYLSSGVYVIFLILSFKGFIDWNGKRNMPKDLY